MKKMKKILLSSVALCSCAVSCATLSGCNKKTEEVIEAIQAPVEMSKELAIGLYAGIVNNSFTQNTVKVSFENTRFGTFGPQADTQNGVITTYYNKNSKNLCQVVGTTKICYVYYNNTLYELNITDKKYRVESGLSSVGWNEPSASLINDITTAAYYVDGTKVFNFVGGDVFYAQVTTKDDLIKETTIVNYSGENIKSAATIKYEYGLDDSSVYADVPVTYDAMIHAGYTAE